MSERIIDELLRGTQTIGFATGHETCELDDLTELHAVFRQKNRTWALGFAGKTVNVKHGIGLEYIAYLLANPGESLPVMSLHRAVVGQPPRGTAKHLCRDPRRSRKNRSPETLTGQTRQVLADRVALAQCEQKLCAVEDEIRRADDNNDEPKILRLKQEREKLKRYLRTSKGPNGQLRRVADIRERTRKSVENAIRRKISQIHAVHKALGRHLDNSIKTGFEASYNPEEHVEWRF